MNANFPETLATAMLASCQSDPGVTAWFNMDGADQVVTLEEVVRQARGVAMGLSRLGLARGDVLAVQTPANPTTMVVHAAAAWLGLTLLPIIHIYGGAELEFILRQSGAKALVTPQSWRRIDFPARRALMRDAFPDLIHIVEGEETGAIAFATLATGDELGDPVAVGPDDVALLVYTSGTTSEPKGVQHSHRSLLAELAADREMRGALRSLSPWPPGHIAGVLSLMRFWAMGQAGAFMDAWDGPTAARLIEQYRIQATSGTPFHITTLLDAAQADGRDLSSLSDYMAGATMIPPTLIERCQQAGLATYRAYGLSEHPTISSGTPADPIEKRLGTDGRLMPGVEVQIVDDAGNVLPVGGEGEIWSRGPDRFVGYRDAQRNAEALAADGWLRTGDIGRLDADGYLAITDRKKDIIIRGGENIASREVEDMLCLIPGVVEAAVVGSPDPLLGERVCAFLVVAPGTVIDLADVQRHFGSQQVARQKTPEQVHIVADLPRNTAGKVLKPDLRAMLREPATA